MNSEVVGNAEQVVAQASKLVTTWGLRVIGALAVLVVGRMVAGMVRRSVSKSLDRANVDTILRPFLSGLAYYLTLAVVLIAVLRLFGIETTSLVAVLGAAGLAVGLALQGTLSNFAAGIMLLLFRPFEIGDFVAVGGTTGKVLEVGIFVTVLATPDNVQVIVPNAQVWGHTITNYNGFETRRIDLVVGVSYDDDLGVARDVMERVVAADERVLEEPATQVAVSAMGSSSVDFVVRPWCSTEDYWALRFDLTRRLKEELEAAGCSIPYPQQDVYLHQVPVPD